MVDLKKSPVLFRRKFAIFRLYSEVGVALWFLCIVLCVFEGLFLEKVENIKKRKGG